MRPLLSVVFVPSTPINEVRLSTAGSSRMTRAKACCRSAIVPNDTACGPSVMPRITPVSWSGKNPLGIRTNSTTVTTSVATVTTSVAC